MKQIMVAPRISEKAAQVLEEYFGSVGEGARFAIEAYAHLLYLAEAPTPLEVDKQAGTDLDPSRPGLTLGQETEEVGKAARLSCREVRARASFLTGE
jgi:hypothetical protein